MGSFDIDSNGILLVSAKDNKTGKEQKIEIKASSGLSDEEIDKMVKDGKLHEAEDKKFAELVTVRNNADAIIHGTEKNLKELGEKINPTDRGKVEAAINELKEVIKNDDKSIIEAKINNLNSVSTQILSQLNQSNNKKQETHAKEASNKNNRKDDVVDAEF